MKILVISACLSLLIFAAVATNQHAESMEDNDFAEFEDTEDGTQISLSVTHSEVIA